MKVRLLKIFVHNFIFFGDSFMVMIAHLQKIEVLLLYFKSQFLIFIAFLRPKPRHFFALSNIFQDHGGDFLKTLARLFKIDLGGKFFSIKV